MAQKRKSLKKSFRKSNRSTRRKSKTNKRKSRKIRGGDTLKQQVDTLEASLTGKAVVDAKMIEENLNNIIGKHMSCKFSVKHESCEAEKKSQYERAIKLLNNTNRLQDKKAYYIEQLNAKIKAHSDLTDNTQNIE